ncbi:hypothetical protein MMC34_007272 [Xylographa carneopallida]|nr:hypothetical protein [Xylographa carneopallida]
MSTTTPTYPEAKPGTPARSFSGSSSTFQSIFHSTTHTTCSGPSTPLTSLSRSPTAETTLFARIRPSRSRSPMSRSPVSLSSSPTSTSAPSPTSEEGPGRSRLRFRTDSSTSTGSQATRPRSRSTKRHSGTVMQCGRHGNDWLFGGFSFTEAVRGLLSPTHDGEHPPTRH